jgi:hypothetical protein
MGARRALDGSVANVAYDGADQLLGIVYRAPTVTPLNEPHGKH